MDVDLRRPSLHGVFVPNIEGTGLVDVLRGDLPWQRTVVQTDLPNLDFLPTGDTRDVPIEVLGSLELRQLLVSLSEHHYDRVILDGPGRARPGGLPDAGADRRRGLAGGPVGLAGAPAAPAGQVDAGAVPGPHRRASSSTG